MTTHDALGYYAGRYGLEVIGAVLPSLSTQAQPSARDIQDLVDQIEQTGVKAIYPESSINPKLERAVARESGAERRVGAVGGHARAGGVERRDLRGVDRRQHARDRGRPHRRRGARCTP